MNFTTDDKAAYLDDNNEVVELVTTDMFDKAGGSSDGAAIYSMDDHIV